MSYLPLYTINVTLYDQPTEAFLDVTHTETQKDFYHITTIDGVTTCLPLRDIERIVYKRNIPQDVD